MGNVTLKINGMTVSAPEGSTILEAARLAHIEIPTLCYLKEINEIGACRVCIVEVKGANHLWRLVSIRSMKGWKFSPIRQKSENPEKRQ